jgi:multicomponent Na+:H+ antiporter subunit D
MVETLVIAPLLVALVTVLATLVVRVRARLQRALSVLGALAYAGAVVALAWTVVLGPSAEGVAVYQVGGWPAPFGITLVADGLSVFMLTIAAAVGLTSVTFSTRYIDVVNQQVFYHPLFHLLVVGVTGGLLTGDLFNLFVWFEVLLMASYVFVAFYGGAAETAGAFRYLVVNVVGSALMLLGIGGLYAVTGTLNMAELSRRLADPAAAGIDPVAVVGLSMLLFVTFALKAGLVPFQFWVPDAYRAAPLPVTAMLAGVTKKLGIYAIVRLSFTVFGATPVAVDLPMLTGTSPLSFLAPVLALMAATSILVGGMGAVSRETFEGTFAYSSVGQVGFIVVPVAIAAATDSPDLQHLALVAALVFAFHHALAKSLLFLVTATVQEATGTNRFAELGGIGQRAPAVAGAFLVGTMSLVGIPPLLGFFGKFLVFQAAVGRYASMPSAAGIAVLAVLLLGAVLTIVYTTRAWGLGFWGSATKPVERATFDPALVAILAVVTAALVLVGVGFEPVASFADLAADAALDRAGYVDAVDPAGGGSP